jgi:predicted nucleic acid-binding protein
MSWVVDTCLVIDIAENDPRFGKKSAKFLDSKLPEGLVLCPISYVELSPVFQGDPQLQDEFLQHVGIQWQEAWSWPDTKTSHKAWLRYVQGKRSKSFSKRPIADIMIGAFALRFQGLLTRNVTDFKDIFPSLSIVNQ